MTLQQRSENGAPASNRGGWRYLQRTILLRHLAMAERHIVAGSRCIARQCELIAELERHGHGGSQTVTVAREVLQSFEMTQALHLADRERLKRALGS